MDEGNTAGVMNKKLVDTKDLENAEITDYGM